MLRVSKISSTFQRLVPNALGGGVEFGHAILPERRRGELSFGLCYPLFLHSRGCLVVLAALPAEPLPLKFHRLLNSLFLLYCSGVLRRRSKW